MAKTGGGAAIAQGSDEGRSTQYRLSATLLARDRGKALLAVTELGLDRVPDVKGKIRLLLWPEELRLLLARGFEVQLHRAIPVSPLDPKLIRTDKEVQDDLERRLRGTRRKGGA